jgi:hypothetical protein
MSNKTTDVAKVEHHLKEAEKHLNIAIGEMLQSSGGMREWFGSLGELKTLVKIKLKLEPVIQKASNAVSSKGGWRL